jgi:hypothetical protein
MSESQVDDAGRPTTRATDPAVVDAEPVPAPASQPTFVPAQPNQRTRVDQEAPSAEESVLKSSPVPATGAAPGDPLLRDAAGLRSQWQRVQASFVDDPQLAVGDAADLVEQTAQALVGALRQRQRELRAVWERGAELNGAAAVTTPKPDTEHLRLLMQRYRALFNQLCRP